jgi:transposase
MLDYPSHPFAPRVKAILQAALATRDRHCAMTMSARGLAVARGRHLARLAALLTRRPSRVLAVRRFAAHQRREFDGIFSFLFDPALDATTWRAEQALRPAVVNRKMSGGGNRTARGAHTQQILMSVLRTADQRGLDSTALLVTLLRAPQPIVPPSLQLEPAAH